MAPAELAELLAKMDPDDGFGIQEVNTDGSALYLVFKAEGLPVPPELSLHTNCLLWKKTAPQLRDHGERDRSKLLLDAICRFINTGGQLAEIDELYSDIRYCMQDSGAQLNLPGFYLVSSELNADNHFEHIFASDDSSEGIRWVEGQFIESVSLVDLINELRKENHDAANPPATGEAPANGVDPPLLGPASPEPPEEPL